MLRLGAAGKSLGEIGVEAPSVGDCIRAIHRAPIEVRSAPLERAPAPRGLAGVLLAETARNGMFP